MKFFKNLKTFVSDIKPIILSHHPKCDKFKNHTINIKGKDICIGCLAFYPTFFISLLVYFIFGIFFPLTFSLILGISMLSSILFSYFDLLKSKFSKFLSKAVLALGVFFIFSFIYEVVNSFWIRLLLFLGFFIALLILNYLRILAMLTLCGNCEFRDKSYFCHGFRKVYTNLIRDGFINAPKGKCPNCNEKLDLASHFNQDELICPFCKKVIKMP